MASMTLRQKQSEFVLAVSDLIQEADDRGYSLTLGEAWRSPEEAKRLAKAKKGISNSLHTIRLAIDLNLFIDGVYQKDTEAYRPLGEWWEKQSTRELTYVWGGHWGDGNHFSFSHGGRK